MLKNQQLNNLHSYFNIKPARHDCILELVHSLQSQTAVIAKKVGMNQQELVDIAKRIQNTIEIINSNSFIDILNSQTISIQTIEIIVFAIIKLIKQPFCIFIHSFIHS